MSLPLGVRRGWSDVGYPGVGLTGEGRVMTHTMVLLLSGALTVIGLVWLVLRWADVIDSF